MSAVGLWIDWGEDLSWGDAHANCTALLISATYTRGSAPEITGAAQAGSATFVLQNPAGLFDPDNAAGPLYGKLHDGVPVWFGVNEDGTITTPGTVRGRFGGRIVEVAPLPVAGAGDSTPTAEIVCEDALGWYGRTPVELTDECSPVIPPCSTDVTFTDFTTHDNVQLGSGGWPTISITPSTTPSVIIAGAVMQNPNVPPDTAWVSGAGYTTINEGLCESGHPETAVLYRPVSSGGTYTPNGTYTPGYDGADQYWGMAALAVQSGASAPTQTAWAVCSRADYTKVATFASPPTPGNAILMFLFVRDWYTFGYGGITPIPYPVDGTWILLGHTYASNSWGTEYVSADAVFVYARCVASGAGVDYGVSAGEDVGGDVNISVSEWLA
jgi:hypothetical protein